MQHPDANHGTGIARFRIDFSLSAARREVTGLSSMPSLSVAAPLSNGNDEIFSREGYETDVLKLEATDREGIVESPVTSLLVADKSRCYGYRVQGQATFLLGEENQLMMLTIEGAKLKNAYLEISLWLRLLSLQPTSNRD